MQLCPVFAAPVLPGDTLKNASVQMRAVTDPIAHGLTGWWLEVFLFYVRLRDLGWAATDPAELFTDPDTSVASADQVSTSPVAHHFASVGGVDYVGKALDKIAEHYFREPSEAAVKVGDYHVCRIAQTDALSTAILETDVSSVDFNVDTDASGTVEASEIEEALVRFQMARNAGVTDLDFEDWLRERGVMRPRETDRPELLRYLREWTFPTNTVNAADGTAAAACSWLMNGRADKDRYFAEPGFVIGVTTARPKVYRGEQTGLVAGFLQSALDWLPADLAGQWGSTWQQFASGAGPIPNQTGDYRLDMASLFQLGEQFTNVASPANSVALPTATLGLKFPSGTDLDALFVSGTANEVRADGIAQLAVAGRAPAAQGRAARMA